MGIGITLTALPQNPEEALRVTETLSRAATGLAFDGMTVSLALATYDDDEEDVQ